MKRLLTLMLAACAGLAMAGSESRLQADAPEGWLFHGAAPAAGQLILAQNTEAPTVPASRDVPYVSTPHEVVAKMLELAEIGSGDVVYDLGSGDGRIVIAAVRDRNARRGVGIDIDPQRIKDARENAKNANVADRVSFRQGNIFEEDFSEATVITLYLLTSVNLRLRPRLLNELSPGTRIVSHAFAMGDWEPDRHAVVKGNGRHSNVYFWWTPANVSGTWKVQLDGRQQDYTLELKQQFQDIAGTMEGGGHEFFISEGRVEGETVSFTANPKAQDGEEWTFTGTVQENTITGTLKQGAAERTWKAERDPTTRRPLEEIALSI